MVKCCDMSAGKLNTVVEFQRGTETDDGAGDYTTTWAAISGAPTWAAVKSVSGGERYAAQRVDAMSTHKMTVRYFADITEKDRVQIGTRYYNITFIDNVEFADRWLQITLSLGGAVSG